MWIWFCFSFNFFRYFRTSSDTRSLLKMYCIVGLVVPTFFTFALAAFEHFPSESLDDFRPNIGLFVCAISNKDIELFMWIIPMSITILVSFVFVILSVRIILHRISPDNEGYTRLCAKKDWFVIHCLVLKSR